MNHVTRKSTVSEVLTVTDPHMDPHDPSSAPENSHSEQHECRSDSKQPKGFSIRKRWIFFGTLALIFVAAYCIVNRATLSSFFSTSDATGIGNVLAPLIIGCIIAYLLNPILKFYEYVVFRKLKKKGNLRLGISLLCTFLTALAIVAVLVALILPELYNSIKDLVENYETYLDPLLAQIQGFIDKAGIQGVNISTTDDLIKWLTGVLNLDEEDYMSGLLDTLKSIVSDSNILNNIWLFLTVLFNSVVNFVLGIFIAFYILSSKEKRVAQVKKFRAACLNEKQDTKFKEVATLVDKTFGGYIKGLLVDALAVGVAMFIALSVFRVSEYNLLIAAICAVTNFIPVFGPFIGAIPSGLIILITNPEKLLLFIAIVLVIQQLDGNILVPLIQGNNTGISSLAVLVSITVMGGLFGIPGMILGVPVFAVVIELCKRAIEDRLRKQGKETDTTYYYRKTAVGNAEEEVYYEHAHWKYKYDHSRIKPHVDKVLAALSRKRKQKKAADIPVNEAPVDASPAEEPAAMAAVTAETAADETENGSDEV